MQFQYLLPSPKFFDLLPGPTNSLKKTSKRMNFIARLTSIGTQQLLSGMSTSTLHRVAFSSFSRMTNELTNRGTFLRPVVKVETSPIVAGLKHVARPRRRCKHCYAVVQVGCYLKLEVFLVRKRSNAEIRD